MPTSRSKNKIIGITLGDPAGIGPEIIAKALAKASIRSLGKFTIIGEKRLYERYSKKKFANCTVLNVPTAELARVTPGKPTKATGAASYNYLQKSVAMLKKRKIHSLVTAPICKESICKIVDGFQGHTEYLAQAFDVQNFGMMFVANDLHTVVVTRHIPIKDVPRNISSDKIFTAIELTYKTLQKNFQLRNPTIAVCGLNPHAGEGGKIGDEEMLHIVPAIVRAKNNGMSVHGPFPADTLFIPEIAKDYNTIICMYHDQGLIALKTLYFKELVNMTIGLPFVRTSPAHGTAFNIAGTGKADESSICAAIRLAANLS